MSAAANASFTFSNAISLVQKELFVRPVIWSSVALGLTGFYFGAVRTNSLVDSHLDIFLDQNEMNMRTLMERELSAELNLLFSAPTDSIPVFKRHVWQMGQVAQELWQELNCQTADELSSEQSKLLLRQFRSQALDIFWTLAEQRGRYTQAQRQHRQLRHLSVFNLPLPIPSPVRPFPFTQTLIRDVSVTPPPEGSPRSEFVKYYALRYKQVDL